MIEMRYALRPDTNTDPPRLQYRFIQPCTDASGALCPGEWTDWRDVPRVVVSDIAVASRKPAADDSNVTCLDI